MLSFCSRVASCSNASVEFAECMHRESYASTLSSQNDDSLARIVSKTNDALVSLYPDDVVDLACTLARGQVKSIARSILFDTRRFAAVKQ